MSVKFHDGGWDSISITENECGIIHISSKLGISKCYQGNIEDAIAEMRKKENARLESFTIIK